MIPRFESTNEHTMSLNFAFIFLLIFLLDKQCIYYVFVTIILQLLPATRYDGMQNILTIVHELGICLMG